MTYAYLPLALPEPPDAPPVPPRTGCHGLP